MIRLRDTLTNNTMHVRLVEKDGRTRLVDASNDCEIEPHAMPMYEVVEATEAERDEMSAAGYRPKGL